MRKYITCIIIALGLVFTAQAQVKDIAQPAWLEYTKASALWFHTNNAAGMAVMPLSDYNQLFLSYHTEEGAYKLQQQGDQENNLVINTNGALSLGETRLWGAFNYTNTTLNNTRYNTMLLDPTYDMPYYVADPNISWWKIQTYDMSVKAATPLYWDRIAFGATINYFTKAGAKQIDPRTTSYKYGIVVTPSMIIKLSDTHVIGLSGTYSNVFERTVPVNSNSQQDQGAYQMKGLGNWATAVVGSLSGVNTFYYKQNLVGGALQYGFHGGFDLVAEVNHAYRVIDVIQTPSKPQRMGSTVNKTSGASIQLLFGDACTSKLFMDGYRKQTDGIEYVQEIDDTYEVQQWVTIAKYVRSHYQFTAATLGYELFAGKTKGYNWKAGIKGIYSDRSDEYVLPHSIFSVKNTYGELYGAKNFETRNSAILVKANVGYNYNLDGAYEYNGADENSRIVIDMYGRDLAVLTSNYIQAGLGVNLSFPISHKAAMYIEGNLQYLYAFDEIYNDVVYSSDVDETMYWWTTKARIDIMSPHRIFANFSIGFTF